jgi:L-ascorbate metabolism protein UlaG (beta-lactamase superfamily)
VGFIVDLEEVRIYHAGDTDFIPEMRGFKVDVALLPVSGVYVMTAEEAAEAAKALNPRVAIPMHYGAIVGTVADAKRFQSLCKGLVVEVLEKQAGDR